MPEKSTRNVYTNRSSPSSLRSHGWPRRFAAWIQEAGRIELVVIKSHPTGLLNLLHHLPLFPRRFLAAASQLHGTATTTISTSNERMLNWNRQSKNQGGEEPEEHQQQCHADGRHGDQHGPALVPVEGEPLEPLGQEQKSLHGQQSEHDSAPA